MSTTEKTVHASRQTTRTRYSEAGLDGVMLKGILHSDQANYDMKDELITQGSEPTGNHRAKRRQERLVAGGSTKVVHDQASRPTRLPPDHLRYMSMSLGNLTEEY